MYLIFHNRRRWETFFVETSCSSSQKVKFRNSNKWHQEKMETNVENMCRVDLSPNGIKDMIPHVLYHHDLLEFSAFDGQHCLAANKKDKSRMKPHSQELSSSIFHHQKRNVCLSQWLRKSQVSKPKITSPHSQLRALLSVEVLYFP